MENFVEVYEDDITLYIAEYMESREIEDTRKLTSSMWAACLLYVHDRLFKNDNPLRQKGTRNHSYNLPLVQELLEKYIGLCCDHNQRICIDHFSLLSGIPKQTISYWATDQRRAGDSRAKAIYNRLVEASLMAADDLMLSRSGVNSIAYRNAVHDRYENRPKPQETGVNLPDLATRLGIGGGDQSRQALPEIEQEQEQIEVKKPWETGQFDFI